MSELLWFVIGILNLVWDLGFAIYHYAVIRALAPGIGWGCGGGAVMPRHMRYIGKRKAAVIIKSKAILATSPIYLLTK